MAATPFDDLTDVYEATIDWPKRLAHEEPFYRWLFEQIGVQSVLDAACGTGHHVNLFRSWGLRAEGADLSQAMLDRCRRRWGESESHRWVLRGYDQPVSTAASLDVAICVGNSLALAADLETVRRTIGQMLGAVRIGGAVVVHVLNLWRIPQGQPIWQKCVRAPMPQGDSLIIKGVHRCGDCGYVDLLATLLTDPPELHSECVRFLGLEPELLERAARESGASSVQFFGNYQRRPFDRQTSQDLIMLAQK